MKYKCLYLVAVPIGNFADFTLRAIDTLRQADLIIGEERATTEKILKKIGIENKEIYLLNEHNEALEAQNILNHIIKNNLSAALISEAGTPCIADPGAYLVDLCHKQNIKVVPVPGVSSIMTALMVAGLHHTTPQSSINVGAKNHLPTGAFNYIGFLSPNSNERKIQLKKLKDTPIPTIILETPYRMKPLLKDINDICGENQKILFAYKLTKPDETIIRTTIKDLLDKITHLKKDDFVVILLPKNANN